MSYTTLYIIISIIILLALLGIIITIYYNKFQFAIIKIDEAENNINILLEKKKELLNRCIPIIKEELKMDSFLDELDEDKVYNNFELNELLKDCYNALFKVLDDNEKLYKSESLSDILEKLNKNDEELVASIKFYNDSVVIFNKLIASFPSNIIRLLFHYKKKEFYSHEKREIYEILKKH